jgi:hypothetical protein
VSLQLRQRAERGSQGFEGPRAVEVEVEVGGGMGGQHTMAHSAVWFTGSLSANAPSTSGASVACGESASSYCDQTVANREIRV